MALKSQLTPQFVKETKKTGFEPEDVIFADLLSLGYSEQDAFVISHPVEAGMPANRQKSVRKGITSKAAFSVLVDDRRKANAAKLEFSGDISDVELIDNETTAKEILKIARQMPENSKERGEMFMKYADLTRKNDAATEEQSEAISFFFPVKCNMCPLLDAYNGFVKEQKRKDPDFVPRELRPVEMEMVIRRATPIIKKALEKEKSGE